MNDAQGEKEIKHRGEETTVDVNSGMKKRTTPSRIPADEEDNTEFGRHALFRSPLFRIKLSHQKHHSAAREKIVGKQVITLS